MLSVRKHKVGVGGLKPYIYDNSKDTRIGQSYFYTSLLQAKLNLLKNQLIINNSILWDYLRSSDKSRFLKSGNL